MKYTNIFALMIMTITTTASIAMIDREEEAFRQYSPQMLFQNSVKVLRSLKQNNTIDADQKTAIYLSFIQKGGMGQDEQRYLQGIQRLTKGWNPSIGIITPYDQLRQIIKSAFTDNSLPQNAVQDIQLMLSVLFDNYTSGMYDQFM